MTTATDIPAKFNRVRFQLSTGDCPNKRLQELWAQYGEDAFELRFVKRLEYDDPKGNRQEELGTLCELCLLENPKAKNWKFVRMALTRCFIRRRQTPQRLH